MSKEFEKNLKDRIEAIDEVLTNFDKMLADSEAILKPEQRLGNDNNE